MIIRYINTCRQRQSLLCSFVFVAGIFSGCGNEADSPEERIKESLAALEQAAEARELGPLRNAILDEYSDNEGHDKKSITQLIRVIFLRQQNIHLLTRIKSIQVLDTGNAIADVLVAMAGRPVDDVGTLMGLSADLFRFEVELKEQGGDWKVAGAIWRRATPDEFL